MNLRDYFSQVQKNPRHIKSNREFRGHPINDIFRGRDDFVDYEDRIGHSKKHGHFHELEGITSPTKEHQHEYYCKTVKTDGAGDKHIHYCKLETNIENGHKHKLVFKTGPAITSRDGGHIHVFDGITSLDYGHIHFYEGHTTGEIYKVKR